MVIWVVMKKPYIENELYNYMEVVNNYWMDTVMIISSFRKKNRTRENFFDELEYGNPVHPYISGDANKYYNSL